MPQTSCFISPPKPHCDLLASSGVIPFSAHEREGSCLHSSVETVCPTDVGPGSNAHVLGFGILPS